MKRIRFFELSLCLFTLCCLALAPAISAQPELVTVSGKVVDLTCASKAKATMDSWHNADHDEHKTPDGSAPGCATMCLKNGQPAGLFADGKMLAVLACSPRSTLADYAALEVELEGFWGGSADDAARAFVPFKIREKGDSSWEEVDCAAMHG